MKRAPLSLHFIHYEDNPASANMVDLLGAMAETTRAARPNIEIRRTRCHDTSAMATALTQEATLIVLSAHGQSVEPDDGLVCSAGDRHELSWSEFHDHTRSRITTAGLIIHCCQGAGAPG